MKCVPRVFSEWLIPAPCEPFLPILSLQPPNVRRIKVYSCDSPSLRYRSGRGRSTVDILSVREDWGQPWQPLSCSLGRVKSWGSPSHLLPPGESRPPSRSYRSEGCCSRLPGGSYDRGRKSLQTSLKPDQQDPKAKRCKRQIISWDIDTLSFDS